MHSLSIWKLNQANNLGNVDWSWDPDSKGKSNFMQSAG